jgi:hypothetical protein
VEGRHDGRHGPREGRGPVSRGLLFPAVAKLFARKQDDGRAEALLIAEYGRRTS